MGTGRQQIQRSILGVIVLALASTATRAEPQELRLLSAASMQTVFKEVIGDFERRAGYKVSLRYSTMGAVTDRMMGGEQVDLVISSPLSIAALAAAGRIQPGSEVTIAKTAVGMVVPAGDPLPRSISVEDFRQALLGARVLVYPNPAGGGAAGVHIARVIEKLGIAEQLKGKTRYGAGGDVAEVTVAQGSGALGLTQVSEIVGKPGMQFVPVPEPLQNYTGFVAARPSGAAASEPALAFMAFLRTPEAVAVMRSKGMQVDAAPLRVIQDASRNRTWVLEQDAVYLHEGGEKKRFDLPGWIYAGESYACRPDMVIDPQGAAIVSSNVMPVLWRADPRQATATKHEPVLDADTDKDVGFTGLVYAPDQGVFFAVSATYGTLWRIDPLLRRAQHISMSSPLRNACGLALERTKTRRTVVLCARGLPESRRVHLTPDQRSAYVRPEACLEQATDADIALVK